MAAAVAVAVAIPVVILGGNYVRQRDMAMARAAEATVSGPPCRLVEEGQFAAESLKAPKATVYEGVTFARQFGHMDCTAVRYGSGWGTDVYPSCQFTGPNVLVITTPRGTWRFHTGHGQPATVSVPDGEATCVLAANFTMEKLLNR
ncbi:MAG: hypothetical protein ACOY5Y_08520 [Pseudomonadota bacterium]